MEKNNDSIHKLEIQNGQIVLDGEKIKGCEKFAIESWDRGIAKLSMTILVRLIEDKTA